MGLQAHLHRARRMAAEGRRHVGSIARGDRAPHVGGMGPPPASPRPPYHEPRLMLGALDEHVDAPLRLHLLRVAFRGDISLDLIHACNTHGSTGSAQVGVGGSGAKTASECEGQMPHAEIGMEAGGSGMTRAVRGSMPLARPARASYARAGGGGEPPTAKGG